MFEQGHWMGSGFMWLFWIATVIFIIWVVKMLAGNNATDSKTVTGQSTETALDILEKRYAKGEIDEQEFEHKRKDLEQS